MLRAPDGSNVAETILDIVTAIRELMWDPSHEYSGTVAFYNISPDVFSDFYELVEERPHFHLSYVPSELGGLLSFKMQAPVHNVPGRLMADHMLQQARDMGRSNEITFIGEATMSGKNGVSAKTADETTVSIHRGVNAYETPTLVFECGNSQTMPSLLKAKN